jgi:ABC-2 type transport system permease protein
MFGALLYLRLTSLRNLIVFRVGRLRKPKYLVGAVVAVLYLYFFLARRGTGNLNVVFLCVGASVLFLVRIAFAWISPADNVGLRFSEAEIAFLFPAPITRKMLIHFRLMSSQLAILFTSVVIVFFFRRFGNTGGSRVLHALGWWIILSAFDLHLNGTNLTLARLREKGRGFLLWRMAAVAVILLYAGAAALSAAAYLNAHPPVGTFSVASPDFQQGLAESSPLRWIILPFKIMFGPYFADGGREFAVALIPALAILALHYFWVSNTEARFEEGSIALAEKRAATRAAALRGEAPRLGGSKRKAQPGPFPLSSKGPPEIAFLWKNLLSMRSSFMNRRALIFTGWILLCMSFAVRPLLASQARSNGADFYGPIIAMFCSIVAGYTLFLGPQIARQDLRNDLPNMDLLKTYPMEGWRLALGELLAPTLVLTLILWVCIIVSAFAVDSRGSLPWLTPGVRTVVGLSLGTAAPVLCFLQLIIPNLLLILMPSWYQASRSRGGGIELMGQRMILGVGQLLIALIVAAPAAGAAALIVFSMHLWIGVAASIVLATGVVLTILCGEAAVGVWWLGGRFVNFDLSAESR